MGFQINRRRFLERSATLAGAIALTSFDPAPANAARKTATDQVTLGRTGIRLSRLGIGTGTNSGEVQRGLGREGFNRLMAERSGRPRRTRAPTGLQGFPRPAARAGVSQFPGGLDIGSEK